MTLRTDHSHEQSLETLLLLMWNLSRLRFLVVLVASNRNLSSSPKVEDDNITTAINNPILSTTNSYSLKGLIGLGNTSKSARISPLCNIRFRDDKVGHAS